MTQDPNQRLPQALAIALSSLLSLTFLPAAALASNLSLLGAEAPSLAAQTELSLLGDSTSLTDSAALSDTDAAAAHPTNYPHYHRRKVRRVRRVRRPRQPAPVVRRARNGRQSIYLGLGGTGNFFIQDSSQISRVYEGGGGFDLIFGARFSSVFALELAWMVAFESTKNLAGTPISNGTIQSVSVDGKIFVAPASTRLEPFLQVGLGAYVISEALARQLTGVGFDLGGGVDIRLSHNFAIGGRVLYRGFFVDNSSATYNAIPTESAFLSSVSLEGNAQFHF